MRFRRPTTFHKPSTTGSALVLVIMVLLLFTVVSMGLSWAIKVSTASQKDRRERARFATSEALVMMTAAMEAAPAVEGQLATVQMGGNADILASTVAANLENRLQTVLSASRMATLFPNIPVIGSSIRVRPAGMIVHSTAPEMDPYRTSTILSLTARPFELKTPPPGLTDPFEYLDYVPTGHPLAGMIARRYPFEVMFQSRRGDTLVEVTRRVSVFQVPVSQFGRFSSSSIDANQLNVVTGDASAYAFGNVEGGLGGLGGKSQRLWAAQIEDVVGRGGTEAERASNRSEVQVQESRLGGRMTGGGWKLTAPHFYTARVSGERLTGASRPLAAASNATVERAYDAQTFLEVLYNPSAVRSAQPLVGPVQLNVYDATGSRVTSVSGVMRGLGDNDAPGFVESFVNALGYSAGTRASKLSVSAALPAGVSESRVSLNLVAYQAGSWQFRVENPSGATVRLSINGTQIVGPVTGSVTTNTTLPAGVFPLRFTRVGGTGAVTIYVKPPGGQECYLTQWAVAPTVSAKEQGSFAGEFPGSQSLAWHIIPVGVQGNRTRDTLAFVVRLDRAASFASTRGDVVIYAEGVRPSTPRYYSALGTTWADVVFEVAGSSVHSDIRSKNSFTIMSPNPIVLTASRVNYNGLYLVSRDAANQGGANVFTGFDQANTETLSVNGVVGGSHVDMRSYFDRVAPVTSRFVATGATTQNSNPFFKTIVLVDDFYLREVAK